MTSYERVLTALRHKEPDKVPFDLGACVLTGMNVAAYRALRRFLGLPEGKIDIQDMTQQLARIDDDVVNLLKVDVRGVDPNPIAVAPMRNEPRLSPDGRYTVMTDELGISWRMPVDGGHYFDMVSHPLADAESIEDLEHYVLPAGDDPSRFTGMKARADFYVNQEKRAYILGRHNAGIWELALWTSGFEKFFCDMIAEKEFSHALMRKITDYKLAYWEKALDEVGSNVLVVSEADDLATQNSLLVSPELYREMVSPYHRELFGFIRDRARKNGADEIYIFYHTCGSMLPFADLLHEEGVNILNPVQVSAKDMDSARVKKELGSRFTFWGGGVDTQHVLPKGTPGQVKDEVRRRIDDLAPGGGFVFSTVHNVQSDVPPENYMAMWEALQEYGAYR
jgi:uroporphyrinogen decarboxylase